MLEQKGCNQPKKKNKKKQTNAEVLKKYEKIILIFQIKKTLHYLGLFSFKKCYATTAQNFQVFFFLNETAITDAFLLEKGLEHILNYYYTKNKNYKKT